MAFKPVRSIPIIVQNRDVLEAIAGLVKATGSIAFGANATNTKILTIYSEVFEFLADLGDLTPGNIGVQIGEDLEATRDNLLTALAKLTRTQVDTPLVAVVASSTDTILLTYWEVGTVGNDVITDDDDNITVTGMSGGADGGVVNVAVTGLIFNPDIDIGDVHLLNIANSKIDPAEKGEAETAAETLRQVLLGTGDPIPLAFADPAGNDYTTALSPDPPRACTRLRVLVGDSGVVVSLDDGATESFKVPANVMDEIAVAIAADAKVKVKRYTADVEMTNLVVEVR